MAQLALLKPQPFEPMELKADHYVPALQNQSGELAALSHASPDTWRGFTPLVHIVGPRNLREPLNPSRVSSWLAKVATAVGDHPIFLDVLRLDPLHPVETSKDRVAVLERIFWAARRRGLRFVPVAWLGQSDPRHLDVVAAAHATDGRGVALRYRPRSIVLPGRTSLTDYTREVLRHLDLEPSSADLLVDLEFIDEDAEIEASDLVDAVQTVLSGHTWRNVVLLGTSIPSMMGCVPEGTLGQIPRREWELWLCVSTSAPHVGMAFGDYAVQHCRPPEESGGPSMRANIRYTASQVTLVARGTGPVIVEGAEQYRELCDWLTACPEFAGRAYTWGDQTIYDCSRGRVEPGPQSMWRGAGTSHHLRFVTDQLRARGAAA